MATTLGDAKIRVRLDIDEAMRKLAQLESATPQGRGGGPGLLPDPGTATPGSPGGGGTTTPEGGSGIPGSSPNAPDTPTSDRSRSGRERIVDFIDRFNPFSTKAGRRRMASRGRKAGRLAFGRMGAERSAQSAISGARGTLSSAGTAMSGSQIPFIAQAGAALGVGAAALGAAGLFEQFGPAGFAFADQALGTIKDADGNDISLLESLGISEKNVGKLAGKIGEQRAKLTSFFQTKDDLKGLAMAKVLATGSVTDVDSDELLDIGERLFRVNQATDSVRRARDREVRTVIGRASGELIHKALPELFGKGGAHR